MKGRVLFLVVLLLIFSLVAAACGEPDIIGPEASHGEEHSTDGGHEDADHETDDAEHGEAEGADHEEESDEHSESEDDDGGEPEPTTDEQHEE